MVDKKYFLAFDFFTMDKSVDHFYYGIVLLDLRRRGLQEHARDIVTEHYPEVPVDDVTIRVTALNNIDT